MNSEASPRPWHVVDPHYEDAGVEIFDAEGARVCRDLIAADAALIVDAVNERDRLRDIVRRLTEYADAVTGYRPRTIEVLSSEHPAWTLDGAALLREARAALGEGENPTGEGVEK